MTLSKLKQEGREEFDRAFTAIVEWSKWSDEEESQKLPHSEYVWLDVPKGNPKIVKAFLTAQIEKAYLSALSDVKKWTKGRNVTKDSLREVINKLKESK